MPAEGIHLTALREALASPRLDADVRRRAVRREEGARLGALLVDLPYFDRYAGEVVRYILGVTARPSRWGMLLHEGGAITLLEGLLAVARQDRDATIGAIALGLASHLAIDRGLHPLVNALARRHPAGDHGSSHREVEKFHSICFHEQYLGRDLMGEPAIAHYLTLRHAAELADPALARPILAAYRRAFGDAPSPRELTRFGRGYVDHTRLLGSMLGRRIAPEAEKERARPLYMSGPWGDFASHLEAAIEASCDVINAAGAVLDADEHDAPAAFAALARVLPAGTIDPAGDDVDLDRPFAVALPRAA
ncbi:MAG TPA: hypothetical protein VM734_01650 [Kofleriaceae bacterium]|nr:hypothetical protein [Kofleriaceae bacterium]